ncbi:N-acetylmuramic acid/N-acetylglucosamine kinase [Thermoflexales bacterium]|nr:N-acetylmuramic acid/N-acetylglucosamine kinase [Thermoflexales bacterium]
MTHYFLGADVGSTKTHVVIADGSGRVLGLGDGGPGNPDNVGYEGLRHTLELATRAAVQQAGVALDQIAGAGFGVSGLDYSSQRAPTLQAIDVLGLRAPLEAVNDALIGLVAGTCDGWGIAVVSGTGCNCWGWDRQRRQGQVTGGGWQMGEYAGSIELAYRAVQLVAYAWTRRGPATQLTPALIHYTGATDVVDLLHGLTSGRLHIDAAVAPLIFEVAAQGDAVALELIHWAGRELGELAKAVIRQLNFEALEFDVVLLGSMFNGGTLLSDPLRDSIGELAPRARFVRLRTLPVVGAVLLGMEQAQWPITPEIRSELQRTAVKREA